jgi:hypothetical protein
MKMWKYANASASEKNKYPDKTNQTSQNHTSDIVTYDKKLFQNRVKKPGKA